MTATFPEGPIRGPVSFPEFSEAEFRNAISQIEQGIRDLYQTYLPGLYPALDAYYKLLKAVVPDWVIAASYQVVAWCWELSEQLINLVINLLVGAVVPVSSAIRGFMWDGEAAKYSAVVESLQKAIDAVDVGWEGPGSVAFLAHAQRQCERITALAGACITNSTTMFAICGAAVLMYAGLAGVVGGVTGGVAGGAASTPFIGPGGVAIAAASVALGAGTVSALVAVIVEIISANAAMIKTQADNLGTIAKAWPEPVSDYSDGSASDGDRSGWSTDVHP